MQRLYLFFFSGKKNCQAHPFLPEHQSFSSNSLGMIFFRITGGSLRPEASGESAMGTSCFEQSCMAPDPTTQAFFRWAEMMDVVICRPFFRCKHHNHDFFETYVWYIYIYTVLVWMELFEIFQYRAKTIVWAIDEFLPPCSHTLREVRGRVAAVFAWFVIYFSEEQPWVGSRALLGLDVELPDFWRYWRGGAE